MTLSKQNKRPSKCTYANRAADWTQSCTNMANLAKSCSNRSWVVTIAGNIAYKFTTHPLFANLSYNWYKLSYKEN